MRVLESLKSFPEFFLEYLQKILIDHRSERLDDQLLEMHLEIMAQVRPKKVIAALKNGHYPLDSALRICKEHKISDGIAFLFERSGKLMEAIDLHVKSFQEAMKNYKNNPEKFIKKMNEIFESAFSLCHSHSKMGDPDTEELWFSFLDGVFLCQETVIEPLAKSSAMLDENIKRLRNFFTGLLTMIFDEIVKHVSISSLVDKMQRQYGDMRVRDFKEVVINLLTRYSHVRNIYESSDAIINADLSNYTWELVGKLVKTQKILKFKEKRFDTKAIGLKWSFGFEVEASRKKDCLFGRPVPVAKRSWGTPGPSSFTLAAIQLMKNVRTRAKAASFVMKLKASRVII